MPTITNQGVPRIHHPIASAVYEWLAGRRLIQRFMEPLRQETVEQASGLVLEVGAGSGRNFPWYMPEHVERVEAVEPDATMLRYARERLSHARVPISLVQAPAEALPFTDATFDSAVATLVFCSVFDPLQALREVKRVMKPKGSFFLIEHVRAQGKMAAHIQDALVPLTTHLAGNCHWNRDTAQALTQSGFEIVSLRRLRGIQPILVLHAIRP
jgi:ubiquinone/menaquinone biosynthesis C-methylase UbiE